MKAALLAAVLAVSPGLALAQDLTGGWTISSPDASPNNLHCTLMQTGDALSGFCAKADGKSRRVSKGVVTEGHATWTSVADIGGRRERLLFKADIAGDQVMKGTLTGSGKASTFRAVKDGAYDDGLR